MDLNGSDTLIIQGANGLDDSFTVTDPGGANLLEVTDNVSGIVVTLINGDVGRLQVKTLDGDDTIEIVGDIDAVPITVYGGSPAASDTLIMTSTEDQADFIVTPGSTPDSGKVTMDEAVTDFFEIETVV